jgi:hypothetical protein
VFGGANAVDLKIVVWGMATYNICVNNETSVLFPFHFFKKVKFLIYDIPGACGNFCEEYIA